MSGHLLTDREIVTEIVAGNLKVSGLTGQKEEEFEFTESSPIQPSSIDLKIGKIMKPPREIDIELQKKDPPHKMKSGSLRPGETFVVETAEKIELGPMLSAMGFPPARISRNAILMTNPGHVDPGFCGNLSFTLINMGREDYYLEAGQDIVSLLIFRMDRDVERDYAERHGPNAGDRDYWKILNRLSPDFASMDRRITTGATRAVDKELEDFREKSRSATDKLNEAESKFDRSKLWVTGVITVAVAVITVVGGAVLGIIGETSFAKKDAVTSIETELKSLSRDVSQIREGNGVSQFDDRLDRIEDQLESLAEALQEDAK